MTKAEIARLLGVAASYDRRTIGDADVLAWGLALEGLDYQRCVAAIVKHYQQSTEYLMPAHVRRLARTVTDGDAAAAALAAPADPEHGGMCRSCKAVHRADEPCEVLITRPAIYLEARKALRAVSA